MYSVIKSERRSGCRVCVCKLKKIKTLTCLVVDCFERLIDLNYNSYLVRFSISMRGKWCQTIVSQTFKLKIPRRKRFKMKWRITLKKTFGRTNQNKIENNLSFYFLFTGSQENLGNFKNTTSCSSVFNKDKTYVKWRICTLFTYMISVVQSKRERIDDESDQVAMGFSISFDWLRMTQVSWTSYRGKWSRSNVIVNYFRRSL